jgi:hypothetical protein
MGTAGILEVVKGFRRVKGCADMPVLVGAVRARDRQSFSMAFRRSVRSRSRQASRRRIFNNGRNVPLS